MNFLQRLTFLLHLVGFLIGVIALPIMVYFFFDGVDLDDGLLTSIIFTFVTPVLGWGLRWLISGELAEFIPFQHMLISSIPKDGNFGIAFALIFVFSFLYFSSEENKNARESWEYKVFNSQCNYESGEEVVLDYFKPNEGKEKGDPIYCSHYLERKYSWSQTLCEWNDGSNANNSRCVRLKANPEPTIDWINIIAPVTLINLITFYILTLMRFIYIARTRN